MPPESTKLSLNKMKIVGVVLSIFLLLTVSLFSPPSLQAAEPPGWQDLGLYGGQIYDIAFDPVNPNIMFAGSYYGDGLFKSTDGGAHWDSVEGFRNQLIYSISFDPQDQEIIWVAGAWGIYKSGDRGLAWQYYDPAFLFGKYLYYHSLALDPTNRNTVYVGTSGSNGSNDDARVYKTTDGGETWRETSLAADHNVWDLAVNPTNSQEIWAVTGPDWVSEGSIYRSRDRGETWGKVNTGLAPGWYWFVTINPRDPNIVFVGGENGLYRTKNGGLTWSQLEPDTECYGFVLDSEDPNLLYASWFDKDQEKTVLSKSTNGGDTWSTHDMYSLKFICLNLNPVNPTVLYGGDGRLGVFKSTDGGENWNMVNQGIRANQVYASAISPSGRILVGSLSGVYLRRNGGTWEWINPDIAYTVVFDPRNENIVYSGFQWGMGKSVDSGQTWSYLDVPSYDSNRVLSISLNPSNPETFYLGVYYSSGNKGEIYKSTDGGESIRLVKSFSVPVNVVKMNPENPRIIYAGTGMFYAPGIPGGVYKSLDGGETWGTMGTGVVVNALALDPKNTEIVYAGCGTGAGRYAGLFKSTNGGSSWEEKDYGIPFDTGIVDIEIDPEDNSIVYAATFGYGVYIGYDGGTYWTRLGLSDYWLYDVLVAPSGLFASKIKILSGKTTIPSSDLYAGSGSGMLEYTGSGIGVITGILADALTGTGMTGGTLSTNTGGIALSLSGSYVMVAPAGICQVMAESQGYLGASKPSVTVTSGEDTTVDFELTSLPTTFSIKEFKTNAIGPVPVGSIVEFTAQAEGGTTPLYYRFWVASGYGTPNYGNWSMIQNYSPDNSCLWSPPAEGNYVIVAWVTDNPNSGKYHQVGMSLSTRYVSSHPIQVKKLSSNMTYPVTAGTPITFTTEAGGGSGPIKYQYWKTDGTHWQPIQGYSPNGTCTWIPNEPGSYIIVVWASDTESTQNPPLAGWTCMVE